MEHIIKRKAEALHCESIVLDTHCDTLTAMLDEGRPLAGCPGLGHLDLPRLRTGKINVQFFAAFIAPEFKSTAVRRVLELVDLFYREIESNNDVILHAKSMNDINKAITSGKIAAFLSVEGGEALAGSLGILRVLYRLGVRSITLTWNGRNELGAGAGEDCPGEGLTEFGIAVVREMNDLGLLVDVSHLSEQGFWDVLRTSRQPIIASHSNCRALCDHPRNLTDEQIKALAERGGVIGVTFVPDFLGGENTSVDHVLAHIEHVIAVGGPDCVGLGSDFDGTERLPLGLVDCSRLPVITMGLLERGYSENVIKKVLGGNFIRVMRQVIK
ncbi:dipeptidase [Pelotomaculum terephthalicicum JT]|uniref:dipeptidase n=1 Tax=Pelotomaculum TaxID=191373 RepID=UPI0009C953D3|nr:MULTISPECIES: dipeptidase [Pelotomaculum]MCG9968165.1 dipeptidase [Pelotomaculum terephthalicicum JT]OPX83939.1 MAG: Membrane dipeptidase (Peptidase family M19) [Pelotomaculum sp. PtaB.Bin117]OPY63184.1 MAG: Membrane dipeptidase (Peptidase family M19) [Pelotomaculum sp. PtaU1.Bin065]